MPLVINSFKGGRTNTHTHTYTDVRIETDLRNKVQAGTCLVYKTWARAIVLQRQTESKNLTLKPASIYNIEKHVTCTLSLKVKNACCAQITDFWLIIYQRIYVGSFYT